MSFTAKRRPASGLEESVESVGGIRDGTIIAGVRVPGIEACIVMCFPAISVLGIEPDIKASK
jgi:hypothetical protein